jgi:hypothetical protein
VRAVLVCGRGRGRRNNELYVVLAAGGTTAARPRTRLAARALSGLRRSGSACSAGGRLRCGLMRRHRGRSRCSSGFSGRLRWGCGSSGVRGRAATAAWGGLLRRWLVPGGALRDGVGIKGHLAHVLLLLAAPGTMERSADVGKAGIGPDASETRIAWAGNRSHQPDAVAACAAMPARSRVRIHTVAVGRYLNLRPHPFRAVRQAAESPVRGAASASAEAGPQRMPERHPGGIPTPKGVQRGAGPGRCGPNPLDTPCSVTGRSGA